MEAMGRALIRHDYSEPNGDGSHPQHVPCTVGKVNSRVKLRVAHRGVVKLRVAHRGVVKLRVAHKGVVKLKIFRDF